MGCPNGCGEMENAVKDEEFSTAEHNIRIKVSTSWCPECLYCEEECLHEEEV